LVESLKMSKKQDTAASVPPSPDQLQLEQLQNQHRQQQSLIAQLQQQLQALPPRATMTQQPFAENARPIQPDPPQLEKRQELIV
jgi:hypothetical protein